MQRVLSRGEIETLDRTKIPTIYLPDVPQVFVKRSKRFTELAEQSPIESYLLLMAQIARIQGEMAEEATEVNSQNNHLPERVTAKAPPLAPLLWQRHERWLALLAQILQQLKPPMQHLGLSLAPVRDLQQQLAQQPESIEHYANALLTQQVEQGINLAWAPFIMSALQLYCTQLAAELRVESIESKGSFGVCPCCGSLPVASTVLMSGPSAGRRYALCGLCSTQWHIVRVTCTHCESTENISYHMIEQGNEAIRAESCGQCGNYRKVFYQEKDPKVEAMADDLSSIELDLLMGQEGFSRIGNHPFLWLSS